MQGIKIYKYPLTVTVAGSEGINQTYAQQIQSGVINTYTRDLQSGAWQYPQHTYQEAIMAGEIKDWVQATGVR